MAAAKPSNTILDEEDLTAPAPQVYVPLTQTDVGTLPAFVALESDALTDAPELAPASGDAAGGALAEDFDWQGGVITISEDGTVVCGDPPVPVDDATGGDLIVDDGFEAGDDSGFSDLVYPAVMLPALLADGTIEWFTAGSDLPEGAVWTTLDDGVIGEDVVGEDVPVDPIDPAICFPAVLMPALLADGTIAWFDYGSELPEGAVWTDVPVEDPIFDPIVDGIPVIDPLPIDDTVFDDGGVVIGDDAGEPTTGFDLIFPAVMLPALLADGTIEYFTAGSELPEGAVWTDLTTNELWLDTPIWVVDPLPEDVADGSSDFVGGDGGDGCFDDTLIVEDPYSGDVEDPMPTIDAPLEGAPVNVILGDANDAGITGGDAVTFGGGSIQAVSIVSMIPADSGYTGVVLGAFTDTVEGSASHLSSLKINPSPFAGSEWTSMLGYIGMDDIAIEVSSNPAGTDTPDITLAPAGLFANI